MVLHGCRTSQDHDNASDSSTVFKSGKKTRALVNWSRIARGDSKVRHRRTTALRHPGLVQERVCASEWESGQGGM